MQEEGIGKRVIHMHTQIIASQGDGKRQCQSGRVQPFPPLEFAGKNHAAAGQHQGEESGPPGITDHIRADPRLDQHGGGNQGGDQAQRPGCDL